MLLTQCRAELVQANNVTGLAYINSKRDLKTVSSITTPSVQADRAKWVVGQTGNKIVKGPEGIQLNAIELCGLVLATIHEGHNIDLGLDMDTMIVDSQNCKFDSGMDLATTLGQSQVGGLPLRLSFWV